MYNLACESVKCGHKHSSRFHSYNTLLLIYRSMSLSFYFRRQKLLIHVVHNNRGYCLLRADVTFWPQSILALSANSSPTYFHLSVLCLSVFCLSILYSEFNVSQSEDVLSYVGRTLCLFTYSLLFLQSLPLTSPLSNFFPKPGSDTLSFRSLSQVFWALPVFKCPRV